MSIRKIPNSILNTTLHIIRDDISIDDIGDIDTVRKVAYGSILANVQPQPVTLSNDLNFEVRGKIYQPTHRAYFNRFSDGIKREILAGDYAIDTETDTHYLVIGVLEYQSARRTINNSHHIKLMLRKIDGRFDIEQIISVSSKARIV